MATKKIEGEAEFLNYQIKVYLKIIFGYQKFLFKNTLKFATYKTQCYKFITV